jgi:cell division protein ZapA
MPKVDITLNGRVYPVMCGEGEQDRVRELGRAVDETIRGLVPNAGGATEGQLLVLGALTLADRIYDLETEVEGLKDEMEALRAEMRAVRENAVPPEEEAQVTAAVEHLTRRVEDIAARLRSA